MPTATCSRCQQNSHVALRRGVRLAAIGCPHCGATELHLASKGRPNQNAGRRYERCGRCDRRGLHHQHPAWPWEPKYVVAGPFPAGTAACPVEEPVPAGRTRHQQVHQALHRVLGAASRWATDTETAQLEALAGDPLGDCPVCAAAGDGWNAGFHHQGRRFAAGAALIADCVSCQHTVLRAVLRDDPAARGAVDDEELLDRLLAHAAEVPPTVRDPAPTAAGGGGTR
jgi:hypothetical protein